MGRLNRLLAPVTKILTPEQKWKFHLPLAIAAGLIGVGSLFFAYHHGQPGLYLNAIAMVGVVVIALRVKKVT